MNPTDPTYYQKWRWMAPLGLTLIGAGLSVVGEGVALKISQDEFWGWFLVGTMGLALTNAGVSVFGDALKRRMWMEIDQRDRHTSKSPSSD